MPRTTRLLLVDASPYIFRAFFSLPSTLRDPSGRPVNAVRGFADFLLRLLAEEEATHLAIAFDHSLTESFRNRLYPEYKAHREPPPPELTAQLGDARELAEAFGCACFEIESYEADDLVATLCDRFAADVDEVVIVSSDKDLCQLVTPRVALLDFARARRYGPREVRAKFGVRPEQIVDLLALAGDSVDNIPGVAGVGPKTAVALLERFADLDAIYADLAAVEELGLRGAAGVRRRLENDRELAGLSRRLAAVARDAPVETELGDLAVRGADRERVADVSRRLGLGGLAARVGRWRDEPD